MQAAWDSSQTSPSAQPARPWPDRKLTAAEQHCPCPAHLMPLPGRPPWGPSHNPAGPADKPQLGLKGSLSLDGATAREAAAEGPACHRLQRRACHAAHSAACLPGAGQLTRRAPLDSPMPLEARAGSSCNLQRPAKKTMPCHAMLGHGDPMPCPATAIRHPGALTSPGPGIG